MKDKNDRHPFHPDDPRDVFVGPDLDQAQNEIALWASRREAQQAAGHFSIVVCVAWIIAIMAMIVFCYLLYLSWPALILSN